MYSGPSSLVFVEQTVNMLRIRWTAAGGPVTGYKVQYVPLTGLGQQVTAEMQEVRASLPSYGRKSACWAGSAERPVGLSCPPLLGKGVSLAEAHWKGCACSLPSG